MDPAQQLFRWTDEVWMRALRRPTTAPAERSFAVFETSENQVEAQASSEVAAENAGRRRIHSQ